MQSFLARHASKIKGVLHGFDRIRFRGTLRWLAYTQGLMKWLSRRSVLLKDFKEYALSLTDQVREETKRIAEAAQCPVIYLQSSTQSKEDLAKQIAAANGVREGLVCVLTSVEQCQTFTVGPNAKTKHLELRPLKGKCLHQYFYYLHPEWGWSHVRLQTWLPFTVHVVINGRDWLARQLQQAGVAYEKRDNCFVDVADPEGPKQWRKLRKGVSDLSRRAQVSQAANTRYLEALSTVDHPETLGTTTGSLSRPTAWKGRRVRALNPLGPDDGRLLQAISRGEFQINGFRNRNLRPLLFDQPASPTTQEGKHQSAKVTRLLRLLRGHKMISKIARSHRYRLTKRGRIQITALLAAQNANTAKLTELAA